MLGKDTRFVEGMALGMWQSNCFLLGDVEVGTCVVVDPGQEGDEAVRERLAAREVRCAAILLTHAHLDHIWSVPTLAEELDVPVLLHPDDRFLWEEPAGGLGGAALRERFGIEWDPPTERLEVLRDRMSLSFAGIGLEVRHTPGHTPGSSVFLITDTGADDPLLISGDLLFAGSVGRTDFPYGSWEQQMASLERAVLPQEDATLVLPGHGPETTVGRERATNPFLREIV